MHNILLRQMRKTTHSISWCVLLGVPGSQCAVQLPLMLASLAEQQVPFNSDAIRQGQSTQ